MDKKTYIADDMAVKLLRLIALCPYHGTDCWCVKCEAIDEAKSSVRRYRAANSNKLELEDLLDTGLEYAQDALLQHLDTYGENTLANQLKADRIRADINRFEAANSEDNSNTKKEAKNEMP